MGGAGGGALRIPPFNDPSRLLLLVARASLVEGRVRCRNSRRASRRRGTRSPNPHRAANLLPTHHHRLFPDVLLTSPLKTADLCAAASEQSGQKVQLANLLCPGNYAVSGDMAAVKKVMEIAKPEFKARMAVQVGG